MWTTVFEAQDRLHVVYPKGHPIARLKRVTPVALAEFPLILMQRDTSVRAIVDAGFHAAGLMPKATCEAIYMMTAVGMVRAGLGLTILPGPAREIKAEPGLLSKPIDDPSFTRPVSIIKRSGRTLPPLSEAFLERLVGLSQVGARVVDDLPPPLVIGAGSPSRSATHKGSTATSVLGGDCAYRCHPGTPAYLPTCNVRSRDPRRHCGRQLPPAYSKDAVMV